MLRHNLCDIQGGQVHPSIEGFIWLFPTIGGNSLILRQMYQYPNENSFPNEWWMAMLNDGSSLLTNSLTRIIFTAMRKINELPFCSCLLVQWYCSWIRIAAVWALRLNDYFNPHNLLQLTISNCQIQALNEHLKVRYANHSNGI